MTFKTRIANWLGVPSIRERVNRLEELEMFSLADVCDKLSESMIVLTGDGQVLRDVDIVVGTDKKNGVLVLGNNTRIEGGYFRPPKTRTIVEMVDDENKYSEL